MRDDAVTIEGNNAKLTVHYKIRYGDGREYSDENLFAVGFGGCRGRTEKQARRQVVEGARNWVANCRLENPDAEVGGFDACGNCY
jgi:hypothetical protein